MKTIDKIKEKMIVSEDLKEYVKEFNKTKRTIIKALKEDPRTIPQIAEETGLPHDLVTYHIMTLRKYGEIEAGEIDDMDEYFFYKLAQKR